MISRSLGQIEQMVYGNGLDERARRTLIRGVSIDTRTLQAEQLYIPIVGERFDGHEFALNAIEQGAAACLWSRNRPSPPSEIPVIFVDDTLDALQSLAAAYRRQCPAQVIGITGSNGKTSTKDILAAVLSVRFRTWKTQGNLNNHIGVPLTLLQMEENTEMAVIEMGISDLGEMKLLSRIAKPSIAILTNIGEAHLDQLKSRERIAQAKLEMLTELADNGPLIVDGDDPLLRNHPLVSDYAGEHITFGCETGNTYRLKRTYMTERGTAFTLEENGSETPELRIPLLGMHHVRNAAAAIAAARRFGLSYEEIQQGLQRIEHTGMRTEWIATPQFTILNDAYKSNPSSLIAALDTLYSINGFRRKIVVLGDMNKLGPNAIDMHRTAGQSLDFRQIYRLFTIGPLAKHIADAATANGFPESSVTHCQDQDELVDQILRSADEHTLILIKGSRENRLEFVVERLLEASKGSDAG